METGLNRRVYICSMELILPFSINPAERPIDIKDPILIMGSCFSEEIGLKMADRKFNTLINPHGILYNSLSISEALDEYTEQKEYTQKDLVYHNGLWHSIKHHGKFSDPDPEKCLRQINGRIIVAHEFLKKAKWLIVTLGSAFYYRYLKTNEAAGNCHKLPAYEFQKRLCDHESVFIEWKRQTIELCEFNPHLTVVFTVSPVRYIRDGLVENNRSKGILLSAIHALTEQHENCLYFPAYELIMDVLRDYRFYKKDMVHPNHLAVDYMWEKFIGSFCNKNTREFLASYEPLLKSLQHRPLHEETEAHQKFKMELEERIKAIEKKYL